MFLCMVEDCKWNIDCICNKNYLFDSIECQQNKQIESRTIEKKYDRVFSMEDVVELSVHSTSKGSQRKWETTDQKYFFKGQFYYQSRFWNDDLVEVIASKIGKQLGFHCVDQNLCKLDNMDCVYMEHFGRNKFVSFFKLDRKDEMMDYNDPVDRLKFALNVIEERTGLDYRNYFLEMSVLDFLVGNEDRHVRNFGVMWDGRSFSEAALFDFGLGLFEHDNFYADKMLEDVVPRMHRQPFGNPLDVMEYLAKEINLDWNNTIIDLQDLILPNMLAKEYLTWSFVKLGLKVIL